MKPWLVKTKSEESAFRGWSEAGRDLRKGPEVERARGKALAQHCVCTPALRSPTVALASYLR